MSEFAAAVFVAAVAVFVAEFGDKSQLLILAFATRYPALPVIVGLVLAATVITGISVLVGAAVGAVLPTRLVAVVAGLAFIAVGIWTLRGDDDPDASGDPSPEAEAETVGAGRRVGLGLVLTVAATFIVGELGDKTMLVTFGLAASQGPLPTWIGATIGEVAANLVAVVIGRGVGSRLSPRTVRIVSAALFILGGVAVLAGALLGLGEDAA
jgi:putative Ca2+/H+ antiporter (TMEM165/GDT1 family)